MADSRGIIAIASWPRSGNTLIRSLLWHAFGVPTGSLYPDERDMVLGDTAATMVGDLGHVHDGNVGSILDRHGLVGIKTHGPPLELETPCPAIYIVRDGREACVSYQHFHGDFKHRPDCTCRDIIRGNCLFGDWSSHLRAWEPVRRPNTLLMRYEDVCTDHAAAIQAIGDFIGRAPKALELPDWGAYKAANPKFFRAGKRETWRQSLTEADLAIFWHFHGQAMLDYGYLPDGMADNG